MDARALIRRPLTRMGTGEVSQPVGTLGQPATYPNPIDPVRTLEVMFNQFPGDIAVPSNFSGMIALPRNCGQIAFIDVIPGLWASFNGGGLRKQKDGFVLGGLFSSLYVQTDATGSCTIQLAAF